MSPEVDKVLKTLGPVGKVRMVGRVGAYGMWVVTNEGNRAAVGVYERCGFRRANRDDVMMEVVLGEGVI